MMPVSNVNGDVSEIKFKFCTFKVFFFLVYIVLAIIELTLTGLKVTKISFNQISGFVFLTFTTTNSILFYRLAQRWGKLMRFWVKQEKVFLARPYICHGIRLRNKIRYMAFLVIGLCFCKYEEYLFYGQMHTFIIFTS